MMKYSYKFCSLNYLRQWFSDERDLHNALTSVEKDRIQGGIKAAVRFFQVARNLPMKFDVGSGLERYEPLLRTFLQFNQLTVSESNFIGILDEFVSVLAEEYGGVRLISLSSKLLWLRYQKPFVIYDSRARESLQSPYGDYAGFVASWRDAFQAHKEPIALSCEDVLAKLDYVFFASSKAAVHKARRIVSEAWFHERVFDHYLWHLAGIGA